MKVNLFILIIMPFFLILNSNAENDASDEDIKAVRAFINSVAKEVISVAGNQSYSKKQKASHMKQIMLEQFDVKWMARFALGRGYVDLTDNQKHEYYKQYEKYLLYSYLPNLLKYTDETFRIKSIKKTGRRDYSVETEILRHDGNPPIQLDYHVRQSKKNPHSFQIIDIVVEGISAILSQRSEFAEIVHKSGVAGLIKLIEDKNTQYDKQYT